MSAHAHRRSVRGFGLLEVLIALGLVAATLAAAFQIMATAGRGTAAADRYTRAVLLAESRMAELGIAEPLRLGEQMGEAGDGYLWRVSVRPLAGYVPGPLAQGNQALAPLEVSVTVAWGVDERPAEVTLTTLRLARRSR